MKHEQLRLYLVTDRSFCLGRNLTDIVDEAVSGGVTMVQLREKECCSREFVELASAVHSVTLRRGVPLIINDRVDVAQAVGAEGVHLGQSDMPCSIARSLLGPDAIIGLSVENLDDVSAARALDVDYLGVSPVFSTATKTDTAAPFGLDGLRQAVELSPFPCVAIGGINASNAAQVMACGAAGIAVVSAVMGAPNPRSAAAELIELTRI